MRKRKFRIFGDVRDYSRCLSATKDVDIVIHAAAMNMFQYVNTILKTIKQTLRVRKHH